MPRSNYVVNAFNTPNQHRKNCRNLITLANNLDSDYKTLGIDERGPHNNQVLGDSEHFLNALKDGRATSFAW